MPVDRHVPFASPQPFEAKSYDPETEGPLLFLQEILVTQSDQGIWVSFEDDVVGKNAILFTMKRQGEDFLATGRLEKTEEVLQILIHVDGEIAHVCLQKSGIPRDFAAPKDNADKFVMELTRHRPGTLRILAPVGTDISSGDFSQHVYKSPLEIQTGPIHTVNSTNFELTASIQSNERLIEERQLASVRAGEIAEFDFSDIQKPNVSKRTYRYWTECLKHYRAALQAMTEGKSPETNSKQLRLFAQNIRNLPVRGVDKEAIEAWNELANAGDRLANYAESTSGWATMLEAFARGLQGDPFGVALEQKSEFDKLIAALIEADTSIKETAVRLSARHEVQFPQP